MRGNRRGRSGQHEPENHERWLVSYADFMTLLFAFFVVMYAVSSITEGKYRVLSDSMLTAFRSSPGNLKPIQVGNLARALERPVVMLPALQPVSNLIIRPVPHMIRRPDPPLSPATLVKTAIQPTPKNSSATDEPPNPLGQIIDRLQVVMAEWIRADLVKLRRKGVQIEIEINNGILFSSGSATLDEQAKVPLREIATVLRELPNRIHVEGFTDNKPISTPIYPSNWELSAARAACVVHLLMQAGVRPERMTAIGYGEYQPIDDNATEIGRMRNRRVVLVILGDTHSQQQLAGDGSPTALDTTVTAARMAMQRGKPALQAPDTHDD